MTRNNLVLAALLCTAAMAAVSTATTPPALDFKPSSIDTTRVLPKVDDFELLVDTSMSMSEPRKPERKLDVARNVTAAIVGTIPELDYRGGVRTFGHGCCQPECAI